MGMTTTGNTTMRKRIAAVLAALGLALGLALLNSSAAQAQQTGLQQVANQSTSWSAIWVTFACGSSYSVPVGSTWGEGRPNPQCGSYSYQAEPSSVYVGPGWCITRWITGGGSSGWKQYLWAGGSGHYFQLWQSKFSGDYTNHIEAWNGGWCPTSGAAGADSNWYTY